MGKWSPLLKIVEYRFVLFVHVQDNMFSFMNMRIFKSLIISEMKPFCSTFSYNNQFSSRLGLLQCCLHTWISVQLLLIRNSFLSILFMVIVKRRNWTKEEQIISITKTSWQKTLDTTKKTYTYNYPNL